MTLEQHLKMLDYIEEGLKLYVDDEQINKYYKPTLDYCRELIKIQKILVLK